MSKRMVAGVAAFMAIVVVLVFLAIRVQPPIPPAGEPYPVSWAAIAPDPRTGHALLFGGARTGIIGDAHRANGLREVAINDTWRWTGNGWVLLHPEHSPPPRIYPRMIYDPTTGRIVLFGGMSMDFMTQFDDTWTWDGRDWTHEHPAVSPPYNGLATPFVYDDATRTVVLITRTPATPHHDGTVTWPPVDAPWQMWEWHAGEWLRRPDPGLPVGGDQMDAAYDAQSRQVVLFIGGPRPCAPHRAGASLSYVDGTGRLCVSEGTADEDSGYLDFHVPSTWTWDGRTWSPAPQRENPAGLGLLSRDPSTAGVLCVLRQSWRWSERSWRLRNVAAVDADGVTTGVMGPDLHDGTVVLLTLGAPPNVRDPAIGGVTWVWNGVAWKDEAGSPFPDVPTPSPPPRPGDALAVPSGALRQPPPGVPLLFVRDPSSDTHLVALDWRGAVKGVVELPLPRESLDQGELLKILIRQSPDGTMLLVGGTLITSAGGMLAKVAGDATWLAESDGLCEIRSPDGDEPFVGGHTELFLVTLRGRQQPIAELSTMTAAGRPSVVACSRATDLAIVVELVPQGQVVRAFRLSTGRALYRHVTERTRVVASLDGRVLAEAVDNAVIMRDGRTDGVLARLPLSAARAALNKSVLGLGASSDGSLIAVQVGFGSPVQVFAWRTGRLLWTGAGDFWGLLRRAGDDDVGVLLQPDTIVPWQELVILAPSGRVSVVARGLPRMFTSNS